MGDPPSSTVDAHLDEVSLAGREHLDAAYVAAYDQKAAFDPADDLEALRARGLGATSTLVDLGAGTGTFAVAAAAICRRVIAVDVSPAMVRAVRRKAAAAGVRNVECVEAGFLSYEHEGDAPGFIYTRNALHHLPDLWKGVALARMAALIAPGGVLQLRDLPSRSNPRRRKQASRAGSRPVLNGPNPAGPGRSWRRTCAGSTARSRGCSNRCLPEPGSTSWRPTARRPGHTPTTSA